MSRRTLLWILLLVTVTAHAADPVRDHEITADDYFGIAWVRDAAVSPDGSRIAYSEDRWEGETGRQNSDLWVVEVDGGRRTRLTFDTARDAGPAWDAAGEWIYFTSAVTRPGETAPPRDGSKQVWRVSVAGGEPRVVTRVDDGIDLFRLSGDGRFLFYTVRVEEIDDAWSELRKKHEGVEYGHGVARLSELWRLDLESWRAERLLEAKRVIGQFSVSPDGVRVAMLTVPDEELIHFEGWSRIDLLNTQTGAYQQVTAEGWRAAHGSPFGWLNETAWSNDGEWLAFSISFDGHPTRIYTASWKGDDVGLRELPRPAGVSVVGGSLRWRPGGRKLCFLGDESARSRLYQIETDRDGGPGATRTLTPGDVTVDAFDFDRGGAAVVITSTLTTPPDLFAVGDDGGLRRVTQLNPQVERWLLPQISLVRWQGDGGVPVEGVLELPPGWKPADGPLPMVVHLHGGPTSATEYRFRFRQYGRTLLAARGYALLSPNYRGSTGYGDAFMLDLIGRENDVEVKDILAGVDAMIDRGIADPDRLGVMGWSNGGFLTNCLITSTQRFKAASSGAGVVDQVLQWGLEDTPGHVINFMGGLLPWEALEAYREGSPLYRLHRSRTPTVIHVGGDDERVPAAHARTLYRGLHFYGGVPAELLVYPGEPHGLALQEHQRAKIEWDHAWFDRYLTETPVIGDE